MAVEYTQSQRNAIESRGNALIVSAAAGSGKTAVLVERVIGLICDKAEPIDIDRLLVVTFTEAAASEMRSKISAALLARIASEPGNNRLRRQLSLLPGARIKTVHAFCLDLVREHFALCGIPADFSIADEAETSELKELAMENALEELYSSADSDFGALCEALEEEKGDRRLSAVIERIFDKLSSNPDPFGMLESFTAPESQEGWREYLLSQAMEQITNARSRLGAAAAHMENAPELYEKYGPAFEGCIAFADDAREAISAGWDNAYETFSNFKSPRLGTYKGDEHKALAEDMKNAKETFSLSVKSIKEKLITVSEEDAKFCMEENLAALRGLRLAVRRFYEEYSRIKISKKLLDFSDMEHYAYRLLCDDRGEPTPVGLEVAESIDEVLVDEYQDTNAVQEAIFSAVSRKSKGEFYVGDVKQSIYRFRMAKPEIFMERYLSSEPFDPDARGKRLRLSLNTNFRSRRAVLEAANHVFSAVMSREFGDIDYTDDEALHPGAPYEESGEVSMNIIDMLGASDDDDSPAKAEAEAVFAANTIYRMMQTETVTSPFTGEARRARYDDFAILLSSFANKSTYYIRELERLGIPVSGGQSDFWNSMEILVMMSFLRVLDNRRQDIPLIGLLRSPLFFFTPDELAEMRAEDRGASFYDALRLHAERGHEKSRGFLDTIEKYIAYVPDLSAAEVISMIYSRHAVMAIFGAMDHGEERMENLRKLYNMALRYGSGRHRGIYDFIRYAEGMMERSQQPDTFESGGVRLMSIHKSKGLEFPFVILPDLNKRFNLDDSKQDVIFHDRMGIGMRIRLRATKGVYRMPMHRAAAHAERAELTAEELRKLYVAMTRAKEKLIMVAAVQNAEKTLDDIRREVSFGGITPVWLAGKSSMASWILAALAEKPCEAIRFSVTPYTAVERMAQDKYAESDEEDAPVREDLLSKLERRLEPYAFADLSALPSKLTPAGTRRLLEDAGVIDRDSHGRVYVDIYRREGAFESSVLSAAERGSALHLFLENADISKCLTVDGVMTQISAMVEKGVMSGDEAEAIDAVMIKGFAESEWGRMAVKEKTIREYEFSAMFSPNELGLGESHEQDILMNGVIDMLVLGADGITVVDFKSDRVERGGEANAAERHKLQLDIYALAAEKIFGHKVKEKVVFFLRTGKGEKV